MALHNLQLVSVMSAGQNHAHFQRFSSSLDAVFCHTFPYQQNARGDYYHYAHSAYLYVTILAASGST